jgi:SAM-dependent methyltransferase
MVTRFAESLTDGRSKKGARDSYYRSFARRIVARHVTVARPMYEDRNVLEQIITPFVLSRFEPETVLDIGREPYEAFYNEFFVGRELWTVDRDPQRARFGSTNHVVDDAAGVRDHFPEDYFDFVLMNGVFGWGLNERGPIERAFAAIHAVLSPRGILVLGWNDTPDLVPVPLNEVQSLKQFRPYYFEPLGGTSFLCDTFRHTYSFYVK